MAFKYFCVECNVFIVCIVVMQISWKSSVLSEDVATSNRRGSKGDGTNCSVFECHRYKALSRRNRGRNVMCWTGRLLLFIWTATWLYLLMGEIRLFMLCEVSLWQNNIMNYIQLYSFCGSILDYIQPFRRNLHCPHWHTLLPVTLIKSHGP